MANKNLELSPSEMKKLGYQVVDTLVDHFENLHKKCPVKNVKRNEMDQLLHEPIPRKGEDPGVVLKSVVDNVLEHSSLINHPRFFSFVPGPSNFVSVMADALASGHNIFSGSWVTSAGAGEIEILCINWLLHLYGLPVREGGGLFVSGGSMANLIALSSAKRVKLGDDCEKGVIYYSDQTHSSVDRAIYVLGLKKHQIRRLPTDSDFRLSLTHLREAILKDKAAGLTPFCVVANAGTTNTGTIDDLNQIALVCSEHKLWYHIDAAFGGGAILNPEGAQLLQGVELADSLTIDPHKWMYQPYEIGCVMVRDHRWLSGTFRMNPEYLKDCKGNAEEINFYDYGIQLTRRFRALKLYMSFKTFGIDSFSEAIAANFQLAKKTADFLRETDCWEIVSEADLPVICFRYLPKDLPSKQKDHQKYINGLNQFISDKIIEEGWAMLATTVLREQTILRMCLINPRTTFEDIEKTFKKLQAFALKYKGIKE